jgi:hypothetical protein
MTITYTPTNQELTEFVGTSSSTVTLTPDENTSIYVESVSCSEDVSDLVVTTTPTSFTFSSQFKDMFVRAIKFTMQDSSGVKSFGNVSRFVDLPSTYKGLYQYVPPSVEFKDVVFSIQLYSYTGEVDPLNPELPIDPTPPWGAESPVGNPLYDAYKITETWTLVVRQNWQSSIIALQNAVASGSGYQQALSKYPELEL